MGAVLVYEDRIIGEGFHAYAGGAHAEVNAVASVKNPELIKKATLYVSLEPCNHFGKTPPCTDWVLKHKIPNVVIGCLDPNPKVAGSGVEKLRANGVHVEIAQDSSPFQELNAVFFVNQLEKRPYIILKWAETADGFIAPLPAAPFSITGTEAQIFSHTLRAKHHAIMVGKNTAAIDNPSLTNRRFYGNSPIRIVWDKKLSLSPDLQIFNAESPTIILNARQSQKTNTLHYFQPPEEAWKSVKIMSETLYQSAGICSIIVEGGTFLLSQFLAESFFDEIYRFVGKPHLYQGIPAPKITENLFCTEERIGEDKLYRYSKKGECRVK